MFFSISTVTLFFLELTFLFFLTRALTHSLATLFYKITRSQGATVNMLAFVFLPGTIVHELSHLFVASFLFVPVGEIDILPKIDGDEVKLGSVGVAQTDILRRSLIGIAPIIIGLIVLFGVLIMSQGWVTSESWLIKLALVYLVFQVANTMFSSKKDLEGSVVLFGSLAFLLVILILASYLVGFNQQAQILSFILSPDVVQIFLKADTYLIFPIVIDMAVIALAKVFI